MRKGAMTLEQIIVWLLVIIFGLIILAVLFKPINLAIKRVLSAIFRGF